MIHKQDPELSTLPAGSGEALRHRSVEVERGVLLIGVDLGTSRAAISTSNGVRECVSSVVGWPKDRVAQKVLGEQPLFGDRALEHRLSLDLIHPLRDGNLAFPRLQGEDRDRARRAAVALMRHLLQLSRPRQDMVIQAVIGAPSKATKEDKQAILEVAREAGFDRILVVSEPFSVAYGIEVLDEAIIIDIGAGTIDLCRLHGTLPEAEDEITIFKAGNFVDQELARLIALRHPKAQFTLNMVKKAKERFSGVVESSDRAIVTFPVQGKPTPLDITEEIHQAVGLLIPEILEAIQQLVATFDPEFQHRIRANVIVSGGGSQIYGLRRALEEGMGVIGGGTVRIVDEPVFAGANGALKLAREMPRDYWQSLQ